MGATKSVYETCLVYDGKVMPLESNCVGTIVSNCVFEHIEDLALSLKEMARVLNPKGYLLTSVMHDEWEAGLLGSKLLGKPYANYLRRKQVHRNLLSRDGWEKAFLKAGFEVVEYRSYVHTPIRYWLELGHYLALPQLMLHALTGSWSVSLPFLQQRLAYWQGKLVCQDLQQQDKIGSAGFYVLKKI
jgi:SAM-dependent methyltransferase